MQQNFDFFNQVDKPYIILCNPDRTELYSMDMAYDVTPTMVLNGLSQVTMTLPEYVDGNLIPAYALVKNKRVLLIDTLGYFLITDVEESMDGSTNIKKITANSLEAEMSSKRLAVFSGQYKFYDPIEPDNTLIGKILTYLPTWSVGVIDSTLWSKYRSFSVKDTTVYNFLMNDVETAYSCVFEFDTVSKTISAYEKSNVTSNTDIFLSFDNLVKDASLVEKSDEISTCLYVYGAGNLDIIKVNPLGSNAIYNFDYYKTTDWMAQDLIDAIDAWEAKIVLAQPDYAELLLMLKELNLNLLEAQSTYDTYEEEYLSLEGVQKVRIEQNLDYADITAQMEAKQEQMDLQQQVIDNLVANKETITSNLQDIVDSLSFDNNFTTDQYERLSSFIYENTYQNENFIQTDTMTDVEIQEMSQELYDQAQGVLALVSLPRYEFSINTANFLFLQEFQPFINQLELGSIVTINVNDNYTVQAVLLSIEFNYDDPTNLTLTFSNRLRLDNGNYVFADLFNQSVRTGGSASFDSSKWNSWSDDYKDSVTEFTTSALNATNNNIINSTNQEILINQNGLRGRTYIPETATYDPRQMWLTSRTLAFTNDAWQSAKLALGEIKMKDDSPETVYGLIGDVVVGHIIAGNELNISNENNNFLLDSTGAYLNNATFTITRTGGQNKITLDATDGIKIQNIASGTPKDVFYADGSGNLVFAGNLSGATGTFSGAITANTGTIAGWTISSNRLSAPNGDYIGNDGNVKLGMLYMSGTTATFSGNIYAENLQGGTIDISHIPNLTADKITTGTLRAIDISACNIYGSTISWSGGYLGATGTGVPLLYGSSEIQIKAGAAEFNLTSGTAGVYGHNGVNIEGYGIQFVGSEALFKCPVKITNGLVSNGSYGQTRTVSIPTYTGVTHKLTFNNGILTSYTT